MGLLLTISLGFTVLITMVTLPALLGVPPERRRIIAAVGMRDPRLPERREVRRPRTAPFAIAPETPDMREQT